jgi:hypothetical protein
MAESETRCGPEGDQNQFVQRTKAVLKTPHSKRSAQFGNVEQSR